MHTSTSFTIMTLKHTLLHLLQSWHWNEHFYIFYNHDTETNTSTSFTIMTLKRTHLHLLQSWHWKWTLLHLLQSWHWNVHFYIFHNHDTETHTSKSFTIMTLKHTLLDLLQPTPCAVKHLHLKSCLGDINNIKHNASRCRGTAQP